MLNRIPHSSVACLFLLSGCAYAGDIGLGIILNQLNDRIDQIIAKAQDSGNTLLVQAGDQASMTIARAKAAYADSLDKTMKQINPTIQGTIDQLTGMVNDFEKQTNEDLKKSLATGQQIANTLGFSNKAPQVTSFTPQILPVDDRGSVHISINGNFIDSNLLDQKPTIVTFDNRTIQAIGVTTQRLDFDIPLSSIRPSTLGKVALTTLTLNVPFPNSGLFAGKGLGVFKLLVGAVPASPGKITLFWKETVSDDRVQPVSKSFTSDSSHDDFDRRYFADPVPAGWEVMPGSLSVPRQVKEGKEGHDWWIDNASEKPTPSVHCRTEHHVIGHSGKVSFQLAYKIVHRQTKSEEKNKPISMHWGDSMAFEYAPGNWKLHFECFDGTVHDYVDNSEDKYLKVKVTPTSMTISAPYAEQLNW